MTGPEKKRLDSYLAPYRKTEKKAQVATIADNAEALKVLAVWPATQRDWRPFGRAPRDEFERWRWLWSCVWLDREELAAFSDLGEMQAERVLRVCYGLRIAYPDGTISKHAQQLLESHGKAKDPGTVTRGRPKGSKDKTPRKGRKKANDDD